jgi:predicted DNA-binding protein
MRKTSVYLDDAEAESLQRVAAATGRSQAELIREGVRRVIAEVDKQPRAFRSMAKGRGKGKRYTPWKATDLYDKVMGR